MPKSYHVVLEPEPDGGYSVHVPAFPGCHTQGDTLEEALANAREAIEGHIEVMVANDQDVPAPDGNHFSVEIDGGPEGALFAADVAAGIAELDAGLGIPHEEAMESLRAAIARGAARHAARHG